MFLCKSLISNIYATFVFYSCLNLLCMFQCEQENVCLYVHNLKVKANWLSHRATDTYGCEARHSALLLHTLVVSHFPKPCKTR